MWGSKSKSNDWLLLCVGVLGRKIASNINMSGENKRENRWQEWEFNWNSWTWNSLKWRRCVLQTREWRRENNRWGPLSLSKQIKNTLNSTEVPAGSIINSRSSAKNNWFIIYFLLFHVRSCIMQRQRTEVRGKAMRGTKLVWKDLGWVEFQWPLHKPVYNPWLNFWKRRMHHSMNFPHQYRQY